MSKTAEDKKAPTAPTAQEYNTIIRPMITEKATNVSAHNQVVFQVKMSASKTDIRNAVQSLFKVKVEAVNTNIRKGKTKSFKGRRGFRPDVKLAYVTLAEGQSIDISTGL